MINQNFNGVEYTLVEVYEFDNRKIYHFISNEDEKFCELNQLGYYDFIIDDLFIENIRNLFGLNTPEIFFSKLAPYILRIANVKNALFIEKSQKNKIIQEHIERLSLLLQSGEDIDLNYVKNKLDKVNFLIGEFITDIAGFYHPITNSVVFRDEIDDLEHKRTKCHELIHASGGALFNFDNRVKTGFIEGATENAVDKIFGNDKSTIVNGVKFNFSPDVHYEYQVAIIRQMEAVLEMSSIKSVIEGKIDFFSEFGKRYGNDLLRFLGHRSTRLIEKKGIKNIAQYFDETQNKLLERAFDREFLDIQSIEDAKNYLEKLGNFELTRGLIKDNDYFKNYYESKFQRIKSLLLNFGLSPESIESELHAFKYHQREFNPLIIKEELIETMQKSVKFKISEYIFKNQKQNNMNFDSMNGLLAIDKDDFYFVLTDNENIVCCEYGNPSVSTIVFNDGFEKNLDFNIEKSEDGHFYIKNDKGRKIVLETIPLYNVQDKFKSEILKEIRRKAQNEADVVNRILNTKICDIGVNGRYMEFTESYLINYANRINDWFSENKIPINISISLDSVKFITEQDYAKRIISQYFENGNIKGDFKIEHDRNSTLIENIHNDKTKIDGLVQYFSNYMVANQMIDNMVNGILDVNGQLIEQSNDYDFSNYTKGFTGMQLLGLVSIISSVIVGLIGIIVLFVIK